MSKPKQTQQLTQKEKRDLIKSRLLLAPELSSRSIAKYFNCSHHTVENVRQEMIEDGQIARVELKGDSWIKHPYLVAHPELLENASDRIIRALKADGVLDVLAERGSLSAIYAQRLLNKQRKTERKNALAELSSDDVRLIHADLRDGLSNIAPQSIDLLLCDPLYHREHLPTLSYISAIAARVLKDNTGNLLVLYGNRHLPEAMQRLGEHMQYHHTLAYMTPAGGAPSLPWLGVATYWKPLLWYRKPKQPYTGDMIYDIINTGKPDKTRDKLHIYEQDVQGMAAIIERFTDPGAVVLDCCCGSSSTGVACIQLGRRYIGVDIDEEAIRTSKERLAEALQEREQSE